MAGAIKGITIEFRGDTTSLDRALSNVKKEAKSTANELKYIDKAIKFNPTSVDAWRQKQIVLNKAINETKEKLSLMKHHECHLPLLLSIHLPLMKRGIRNFHSRGQRQTPHLMSFVL